MLFDGDIGPNELVPVDGRIAIGLIVHGSHGDLVHGSISIESLPLAHNALPVPFLRRRDTDNVILEVRVTAKKEKDTEPLRLREVCRVLAPR